MFFYFLLWGISTVVTVEDGALPPLPSQPFEKVENFTRLRRSLRYTDCPIAAAGIVRLVYIFQKRRIIGQHHICIAQGIPAGGCEFHGNGKVAFACHTCDETAGERQDNLHEQHRRIYGPALSGGVFRKQIRH